MIIQLAKPTDLSAVEECAHQAYEMYVPRISKKPAPMIADFGSQISRHVLHILKNGTQVIGFIVFYPHEDHLHIENVAVLPEFQGNGYGTKLIEFAEHEAKNLGFGKVELYTNEKMTENIVYYPTIGYEEIGRWQEDGFNRIYFRKNL